MRRECAANGSWPRRECAANAPRMVRGPAANAPRMRRECAANGSWPRRECAANAPRMRRECAANVTARLAKARRAIVAAQRRRFFRMAVCLERPLGRGRMAAGPPPSRALGRALS